MNSIPKFIIGQRVSSTLPSEPMTGRVAAILKAEDIAQAVGGVFACPFVYVVSSKGRDGEKELGVWGEMFLEAVLTPLAPSSPNWENSEIAFLSRN